MADAIRVKLCGLVRAGDVRAAVAAGADYLGFVLAPGSPRTLTPAALSRLLHEADTAGAQRVAVVRDQPAAWINDIVLECGIDLVQLHGHEPRDFPAALAVPVLRVRHVPAAARGARVARAGRVSPPAAPFLAAPAPLPPNVFAILLDTADGNGAGGGRGLRAGAAAIAAGLASVPPDTRVLLAGGLAPENVGATVRRFKPWGVDVSSGIESAPGVKDAGRMAAFVRAAKQAS